MARLAGEVDPALAVDLGHDDHHDLVADGHDVLDGRHVVVGELADPDEAFLARQDLDERAEAHDPGDLAQVERARPRPRGSGSRSTGSPCARSRRETAAISTVPSSSTLISVWVSSWILRIIDPPLPMISRIFSGLILIVMMRGAKSLISARASGMTSAILSRIVRRAARAWLEAVADDRLADALDLDVHLQGGDAVPRAGDLEVHVADRVLLAEDVGQDDEPCRPAR